MIVCDSFYAESHIATKQGSTMSIGVYEQRYSSNNSSAPPPPYSRLPPDGHEFPSSYAEGLPDKINRFAKYSKISGEVDSTSSGELSSSGSKSGHTTPLGPPPAVPRSPPSKSNSIGIGDNRETTPSRASSLRWRRQDEKSEKSVKDKIAMFSSDTIKKQKRSDSVEPLTSKENSLLKRAFTEDDVRIETNSNSSSNNLKSPLSKGKSPDSIRNSRSLKKNSTFSSMINVSSSLNDSKENVKPASSDVDIRKTGTRSPPRSLLSKTVKENKSLETDDKDSNNGLSERSQSLIDIGKSTRMKRHSVGAYDRSSVYKYGVERPEDKERRTSLNNLIEQRRKSMSKLRGLVIPESKVEKCDKPPIDLPKISSVPPSSALKTMSLPRDDHRARLYKADSISSIDSCESNTSRHSSTLNSTWKSTSPVTNHKYSSSYKYKNYSNTLKNELPPPSGRSLARSASPTSDFSAPSPTLRSFESATTPSSDTSFETEQKYSSDRSYSRPTSYQRMSRPDIDSDNDSAVSSTQSSFSQGLSPPSSPMPDNDEPDAKINSRSYRARHSPESSIDEPDHARVLKQGSIEAENRRNVLKSAKCSSGRSSDEQSSTPEIIRKYSGEAKSKEKKVYTDPDFPKRLDSELKEGPKSSLNRQASNESNSPNSSRKSSYDISRKSSKESVITVGNQDEVKVSAEPVYFDKEGEMYKESQVKIAYLNEIVDDFEEINDTLESKVVAEIPISSKQRTIEYVESAAEITHLLPPEEDKWAALELKYGTAKGNIRTDSSVYQKSIPEVGKPGRQAGFKAIANRWKQREDDNGSSPLHPQSTLPRRDSTSSIEKPARPTRLYTENENSSSRFSRSRLNDDTGYIESNHVSSTYSRTYQEESTSVRPSHLEIPKADVPDRKLSMPEYGNNGVKMRERRDAGMGGVPSRPTSLIEGNDGLSAFDNEGHYLSPAPPSPSSTSTDSREDLLDGCIDSSLSRTASKEILEAFSNKPQRNFSRCLNSSGTPRVSDIMKAFERSDNKRGNGNGSHPRMSSVDSNGSDEWTYGGQYGSVTSLASGQRDQYGSITSLASSTSIISTQELAQLIEEANQTMEESGTPSHEILVVVLHREVIAHGSIGITLAGGADYETKEITVHKIIPGSIADRDGRIQRGDRVLSINGKTLRGVAHVDALTILKSPRPEVVLVLSRSRSVTPQEGTSNGSDNDGSFSHRPTFINHLPSHRPPKILESPMDSKSLISDTAIPDVPRGPPMTITLVKDGSGLGFSLEGGKDSPLGDRPLTVKKIFTGGAADKGAVLKVGDEIRSVNTIDVTMMARIEAWNFLKKLPDGTVALVIRQKLPEPEETTS